MSASDPLVSHRTVVGSSDRTFGLVFAGFFLIVALWPLLGGRPLRLWALGLALAFLATGIVAPMLLGPLNRIWARLGLVLHHVVNPVIMALVYYLALLPIGVILRARGKDLLRLKHQHTLETYWLPRDPPGPPPGSMSRQF